MKPVLQFVAQLLAVEIPQEERRQILDAKDSLEEEEEILPYFLSAMSMPFQLS